MGKSYGWPRYYLDVNMTDQVYIVTPTSLSNTYDVNGNIAENSLSSTVEGIDVLLTNLFQWANSDSDLSDDDAREIIRDAEEYISNIGDIQSFVDTFGGIDIKSKTSKMSIFDVLPAFSNFNPYVPVNNPGAYVIVGKARSGKSTWINTLSSQIPNEHGVVHLHLDECDLLQDGSAVLTGLAMLSEALTIAADNPEVNTIIIDSIREIQYKANGTTLPGGINADFFSFITRLSNIAKRQGIAVFLVYNPQAEKEETYQMVCGMVDGAVHGIVDMNKKLFRSRYHNRSDVTLDRVVDMVYGKQVNQSNEHTNEVNL